VDESIFLLRLTSRRYLSGHGGDLGTMWCHSHGKIFKTLPPYSYRCEKIHPPTNQRAEPVPRHSRRAPCLAFQKSPCLGDIGRPALVKSPIGRCFMATQHSIHRHRLRRPSFFCCRFLPTRVQNGQPEGVFRHDDRR
jgi:hypothetical protein